MFVPPQKRCGPAIVILALVLMVSALVYVFLERRQQKQPTKPPVQQLQQESHSGFAAAPGDSP